jgi:hypothetical protein
MLSHLLSQQKIAEDSSITFDSTLILSFLKKKSDIQLGQLMLSRTFCLNEL